MIITNPDWIKKIKTNMKKELLELLLKNAESESNGLTIKQLSDLVHKNPGTVKYHLSELEDLGLVAVYTLELTNTQIVQKFFKPTFKHLEFQISERFL